MGKQADPGEVAAALRVSIGQFVRRLRVPVQNGLTLPEMSALARLDRAGSATSSELARAEQISPQAMGVTLNALTGRGLVERRADPSDGRRAVMSLTEAGRGIVHAKRTARTDQLANALKDGFTPEELEVLLKAAALLERLGESL